MQPFRFGRLGSLEIVLDDSSVSRRHAEVRRGDDGGWYVRDQESTNGTYVNGVRIGPGEQRLPERYLLHLSCGRSRQRAHDLQPLGGLVPRDACGPEESDHVVEVQ